MHSKLFVFGTLLLVLCASSWQSTVNLDSFNIPAFFWSGQNCFSGKNVEVLETVTPLDIQNTLSTIIQQQQRQNALSAYTKNVEPEIVVVFVASKMRTDQVSQFGAIHQNGGAFSQVKQAVENSVSSLVVPYVAATESSTFIGDLVHGFSKTTKVVVAKSRGSEFISSPRAEDVDITELVNYLESHPELFNNGETDVVVVYFDIVDPATDLPSADNVVGQVRAVVEKESNGKFVAVFTADRPDGTNVQKVFGSTHNRIAARDFTDPDSWWPYLIWDVIIGVIPLIIILFIGIWCLCDLQTPARFEGGQRPGQKNI